MKKQKQPAVETSMKPKVRCLQFSDSLMSLKLSTVDAELILRKTGTIQILKAADM